MFTIEFAQMLANKLYCCIDRVSGYLRHTVWACFCLLSHLVNAFLKKTPKEKKEKAKEKEKEKERENEKEREIAQLQLVRVSCNHNIYSKEMRSTSSNSLVVVKNPHVGCGVTSTPFKSPP